ncbi:BgTH12-06495 [Blumeria graminis f. sp. triticale]|nr:BgTH12-06495 [Blumeria graminis f. sp. triticale]
MDLQVENAIEIAWNPDSNPEFKSQAFNFLNQLRSNASGRQACIKLFTKSPKCSDVVRLVSLDLINNSLQNQQLDSQSLDEIKTTILEYTHLTYGSANQENIDPAHLQNKLTQTLTLLFVITYQHGWEGFVDEISRLTSLQCGGSRDNMSGTVLYLRVLGSIHDEIADVIITRSNEDAKRNTELKNTLRVRDVPKIVGSWQEILSYWQDRSDAVVEICLKVIAKWVSWVDISLIVNQSLLNILFQLVGRNNLHNKEDKVRNAAIDTLSEIVAKKVKPSDKIDIIIFLNLGEMISQLIASPPLNELRMTSSYDTDLAEAVAKLINNVVADIVKVLEDTQVQTEVRAQAEQLVQSFLPLLLRFFSDEYDEICSTVIPSLTELISFLRKSKPLSSSYSSMLTPILNSVIQKMRYDETCSWGNEDDQTDEAEFQELRKRLKILQKGVAAVDESLYVEVLSNVVGNTFQRLDQVDSLIDWRDLDLALHEMYLFGELTLINGSIYFKSQPSGPAAERLIAMMTKMVNSGITSFNHPAIQLQYMEICVRYCSFFEYHTMYIPYVLEHFVRFVHHKHVRVRTRSWYLFQRFVKHLRIHIDRIAETVIESVRNLLTISAEIKNEHTDGDVSSDENDQIEDPTFTAQLYLYEAVGCISSIPAIPIEKQAFYVHTIFDPLFSEIEKNLAQAKSGNLQAVQQIHHVIMALGTFSHGFSESLPKNTVIANHVPDRSLSEQFGRAAEAILIALEALKSSFEIRTAARASLSRLMGVLGADMLPFLPRWIDGLLYASSSKEEIALFLRSLDQVIFGFKKKVYVVLDSLLTPLLHHVFASLAEPITGTDDEIQLTELRREYLTFIQIILNNELSNVLISDRNLAYFESLILSVTSLAAIASSNSAGNIAPIRMAFVIMTLMTQLWGGLDQGNANGQPATKSTLPQFAFPGFERVLVERFHPICWDVMRNSTFKPDTDANSKQILHEIAGLENAIYKKTGHLFLQHLQQEFFPSIGVDGSEFIQVLSNGSDRKDLVKFLQGFVKQLR